ncbi:ROK family protein [Streptomyces tanashiensis]
MRTVDEESGRAIRSADLGCADLPLAPPLPRATGRPVVAGHDVRAGGLAEFPAGAARGVRDALFVPMGTDVSAAVSPRLRRIHGRARPCRDGPGWRHPPVRRPGPPGDRRVGRGDAHDPLGYPCRRRRGHGRLGRGRRPDRRPRCDTGPSTRRHRRRPSPWVVTRRATVLDQPAEGPLDHPPLPSRSASSMPPRSLKHALGARELARSQWHERRRTGVPCGAPLPADRATSAHTPG